MEKFEPCLRSSPMVFMEDMYVPVQLHSSGKCQSEGEAPQLYRD